MDGVINRRKGAGGEEFGIGFALALPEAAAWNGDFMMQGGGGGNGVVSYPLGGIVLRRQTCSCARIRGGQHGYGTQGEDGPV